MEKIGFDGFNWEEVEVSPAGVRGGIRAGNYEDGYDDYPHINNMDDCVECVRYADTIIEAEEGDK